MRIHNLWTTFLTGCMGLVGTLHTVDYLGYHLLSDEPVRIGVIGLDTSHAPAFVKLFNQKGGPGELNNMSVVAAFPGGSPDLAPSRDRVAGFTEEIRGMNVEIVDSIHELLTKVDAILLESVDGRKHLSQALPVFRSGKPMFIDKPLAADLTEAIAIDLLAKQFGSRWFSSSSLRFSPSIHRYSSPDFRAKTLGAAAWSPCSLDPTHVDHFWYGIHGVEILYTVMGGGCVSVNQTSTEGADLVVGTWQSGRMGSFRGIRAGASGYGVVVFGADSITNDGKYEGYEPLVFEIARFFRGGEVPVASQETLEIMTFMQAAYQSKRSGGQTVLLENVWNEHLAKAEKLVAEMLDQ